MRKPLLLLALLAASCGGASSLHDDPPFSHEPDPAPEPGIDAGHDAIPDVSPDVPVAETSPPPLDAGLVWKTCSLYPGENDGRAQCAHVPLPFVEGRPELGTFDVFVKRLPASVQPARGQLWFVQGGPGGAATFDFPPWMELTAQSHPDLDMYAADHRGTGDSEGLACPPGTEALDTPERLQQCGDSLKSSYGDQLAGFSTTESARDLGRLADLTREPGQQLFIYGGSYGAYHVLRYLQLYPAQADGVMIDGIAPPGFTFVDFDVHMNAVGQELFSRCGADPFCSSKLGSDPWGKLGQLEALLDNGHCPQLGVSGDYLKMTFGSLLYSRPIMDYLPALTYRMLRCNDGDMQVLSSFFTALSEMYQPGDPAAFSNSLYEHILTSEMWTFPSPSAEELHGHFESAFIGGDVSLQASAVQVWPRYDPTPFDDVWPSTQIPLLMTNGDLDPATPMAKALEVTNHFQAVNQSFLAFKHAGHCVYMQTWMDETMQVDCATGIRDQFLVNPKAKLDTSCMSGVAPVNFHGFSIYNPYLFGQDDIWENASGYPLPNPAVRAASKKAVMRMWRMRAPFRPSPSRPHI